MKKCISALVLFSLLGPLVGIAAAGECDDCQPLPDSKLCTSHESDEVELISKLRPKLDSTEERVRILALKRIAALTREHSNAPSIRVAELLASRAESESTQVRVRAISLLGDGQHPEVAVKETLRIVGKVQSQAVEVEGSFRKIMESGEPTANPNSPGQDVEDVIAKLEERKAVIESLMELESLREALIRSMGGLRDDRVTKMLLQMEAVDAEYLGVSSIHDALLAHGTQAGVRRVIEAFRDWEADEKKTRKDLEKARKQRAPRPPRDWKSSELAWKNEFDRKQRLKVMVLESGLLLSSGASKERCKALQDFASKQGLPSGPTWSEKPYLPWKRWLKEHFDAFPKELGHLPGS